MKKNFGLAIILFFLFSSSTKAAFVVPYFDITLNKTSSRQDGVFNFEIKAFHGPSGTIDFVEEVSVETLNGSGTEVVYTTTANDYVYKITEVPQPGWEFVEANCTSPNPDVVIQPMENGVKVYTRPYATLECNFINQPSSSKIPVVIIPGVLGTELVKNETKLWPDIKRMIGDIGDQFLDILEFDENLIAVDSEVRRNNVITRELIFNYTEELFSELYSQDYVENQEVFAFPYDWRYGVSEGNVEALAQKIQAIKTQTGSSEVNVVAHSTGGLLLKKYIQDHPDDHSVNKAVMVGVPNLGAPKAVKALVQGDNFGVLGLSDEEMKKLAKNMPVVYDLAPNEKYFDINGSFVRVIEQKFLAPDIKKDLSYSEVKDFLVNDHKLNSLAYQQAQDLHTPEFVGFDMRASGVEVYNITGCKTGTLGNIVEKRSKNVFGNTMYQYEKPKVVSGDKTVPFESADSIPADTNKKYYAIEFEHGTLMTSGGTRQLITNILTGSTLPVGNEIVTNDQLLADPGVCNIKGKSIQVLSPLNIEVIDQSGGVLGFAEDGSIKNTIPGADFNVFGDHKFVFLPEDGGQDYNITFKGTGDGTFSLKVEDIENNQVTKGQNFIDLPVSTTTLGSLSILSSQAELKLDENGDGQVDEVFLPVVINETQAADLLAPVSTSTLSGTMGQAGFYRSDVAVNISAQDIAGEEGTEPSGVFQTVYRVGEGDWVKLPQNGEPLVFFEEGKYRLEFFSTDKAGNKELPQALEFTVDKTPSEALMFFDTMHKDLKVFGRDNISTSTAVRVEEQDSKTVIRDQAGNTLEIKFAEKNRRKALKASILGLSYNGVEVDMDKNRLRIEWTTDRVGNIKKLWQYLESKKDFRVRAVYDGKKTKIISKDFREKRVEETVPGLMLLKFWTDKGEIEWGK